MRNHYWFIHIIRVFPFIRNFTSSLPSRSTIPQNELIRQNARKQPMGLSLYNLSNCVAASAIPA